MNVTVTVEKEPVWLVQFWLYPDSGKYDAPKVDAFVHADEAHWAIEKATYQLEAVLNGETIGKASANLVGHVSGDVTKIPAFLAGLALGSSGVNPDYDAAFNIEV